MSPVSVLPFAAARDLVGTDSFPVDLAAPVTVAAFFQLLVQRFPPLKAHEGSIRLAVNGQYASPSDIIEPGDEVGLLPPVSGG